MIDQATTTSLSLALRLGQPHRRIVRAIERVQATCPRCVRYFTPRTTATNSLWLIHGWQGAFMIAGDLPGTRPVWKWRNEIVAAINRDLDAAGVTDAQFFAVLGLDQ